MSRDNIKLKGQKSLFFITDGGDIHDGSFNEAAYNAVTGISSKYNYESPNDSNFSSLIHAYNLALAHGASVLEVNGFLHEHPLLSFSKNHPQTGFIFLDDQLIVDGKPQGNVAGITYETQQVGFLAGYVSAAWASKNAPSSRKTPLISGVGGLNIAPVTTYLAGFEKGMEYFDNNLPSNYKRKVKLYLKSLGQSAKYFGGFAPDPEGQVSSYTRQAIEAGVSVIFPVGGPQAFTVIREMKKEGVNSKKMKVIGVDQDLTKQSFAGLPAGGSWINYVLGSATKSISQSILDLSASIFNKNLHININGTPMNAQKATISPINSKKKPTKIDVFGYNYSGTLKNQLLNLTGQKEGNKTQTSKELFKQLGLVLKSIISPAEHTPPSTPFYGGKK